MTGSAVGTAGAMGPLDTGAPAPRRILRVGALGSAIALYVCLVGIVSVFNDRPLITGVISLGQASLLTTFAAIGFVAARPYLGGSRQWMILSALAAGALAGVLPALLVLVGSVVDVRSVFLNASPDLYTELTLGLGTPGFWAPIAAGAITGALTGIVTGLPPTIRAPLVWGIGLLVFFGLFAGLLRTPMLVTPLASLARFLFAPDGLTIVGAVIVFVASIGVVAGLRVGDVRTRVRELPPATRRVASLPLGILLLIVVLIFPHAFGPFFAQVIAIVALYVLLGLGMNITLGLAGLLDLGFVAFFAVGAYTVGLLTSTAEFGIAGWSFWQAVPFAVLFAMLFAVFLGLPILRIRGDYLAIATLGFGEIVRILAGSDLMKGFLGGPRGIVNIPKPIEVSPTHLLAGPTQIYYLALVCAGLVAFVAWRLRGSRLGRSWMAIREDEDVAEGIGINLVSTKLLAYMLGGGFAGLAGAISAGLVGSIFPSSIQLFLSINVVAIVIVGGMGSIPGVVLGALFLIGLPELFREFSDYRFLFYGIALMAMMIFRPEGLLPSKIARRELHTTDELIELEAVETSPVHGETTVRG
jgi:branched-chain amino acid transport system permease protein